MPPDNIELHRRFVDAFNARDVDGMVALCDPRIELRSAVTATTYEGHAGVRQWNLDIEEAFGAQVSLEPEAYFDLGEHTVTFHLLHARGLHSGADLAERFAHVHTWRDGLTVSFKAHAHQADALEELGVTEEDVTRITP